MEQARKSFMECMDKKQQERIKQDALDGSYAAKFNLQVFEPFSKIATEFAAKIEVLAVTNDKAAGEKLMGEYMNAVVDVTAKMLCTTLALSGGRGAFGIAMLPLLMDKVSRQGANLLAMDMISMARKKGAN